MTIQLKLSAFIKRYNQYVKMCKTPNKITSRTKFLKPYKNFLQSLYPDKKLLEIVYIKTNNLTNEDIKCPICKIKDKKYYSITKGYNLTCSQSCSTTLINLKRDIDIYEQQSKTIKNTLKENKEEILNKRKATRKKNNTPSESEISKKVYKNLSKDKKETIRNAPIFDRLNNPDKTKNTYMKIAKKLKEDIDENGNNHYDRIHIKKLNNIDENGNNHYDRLYIKMISLGHWIKPEDKNDFDHYRQKVWKETKKQPLYLLENIEKRGRGFDEYHLDHRYSIFQGFKDYIPIHIIGGIKNLEMIIARDNLIKGRKCSVTLNEIL